MRPNLRPCYRPKSAPLFVANFTNLFTDEHQRPFPTNYRELSPAYDSQPMSLSLFISQPFPAYEQQLVYRVTEAAEARQSARRPPRASMALAPTRDDVLKQRQRQKCTLVIVVAMSGGLTIGMCSYAFGSYVQPLTDEFHWTRVQVGFALPGLRRRHRLH